MRRKARERLPGTTPLSPSPADKVILSEKDKCHPLLKDAEWLFDYNDNLYE